MDLYSFALPQSISVRSFRILFLLFVSLTGFSHPVASYDLSNYNWSLNYGSSSSTPVSSPYEAADINCGAVPKPTNPSTPGIKLIDWRCEIVDIRPFPHTIPTDRNLTVIIKITEMAQCDSCSTWESPVRTLESYREGAYGSMKSYPANIQPVDQCEAKSSSPVMFARGEKSYSFEDYHGSGSFPVVLQRQYRTNVSQGTSSGNWYLSYISSRVWAGTSNLMIYRPDGGALYFLLTDGQWSPVSATKGYTIAENASEWILKTPEGMTETYAKIGRRLASVTNSLGVSHVFKYESTPATYSRLVPKYETVSSWCIKGNCATDTNPSGQVPFVFVFNKITITNSGNGESIIFVVSGRDERIEGVYHDEQALADNRPLVKYNWGLSNQLNSVVHADGYRQVYHYSGSYGADGYYIGANGKPAVPNSRIAGLTEYDGEEVIYRSKVEYDSLGRVKSSYREGDLDGDGMDDQAERLDFSYNWDWSVNTLLPATTVTNSAGLSTTYTFTTFNKGIRMYRQWKPLTVKGSADIATGCLENNSSYTYDANQNRLTAKDGNGIVTRTERNTRNLVTREQSALDSNQNPTLDSRKVETTWSALQPLPLKRVYSGWNGTAWEAYRQEDSTYTADNRIATFIVTDKTAISVPYLTQGRTRGWNYHYSYHDGTTNLQTMTIDGPQEGTSDTSTWHYDESGNVVQVVNALGHVTAYSGHVGSGKPTSIIDANGIETHITYTERGWVDTITVNNSATTDYDYLANGMLKRVTLPDGSSLEYEYNTAKHLVAIKNNLGERIEYKSSKLDGKWVYQAVRNAGGMVVESHQRAVDALGRVMEVTGNSGQQATTRYDANNNAIAMEESGHESGTLTTLRSHDGQNRLHSTTDALLGETVIGYDIQGNINSVTDARNNQTTWLYDGFGQLIQQVSPDTGTTTYYYDAAGNLTGATNSVGISTHTAYDPLDRPIYQHYLDATGGQAGEAIAWTYDLDTPVYGKGKGRLVRIDDNSGIQEYRYNAYGQITQQSQTLHSEEGGSFTLNTAYHYDAKGRPEGVTYPSGHRQDYSHDAASQLSGVSYNGEALASGLQYHPFSRLAGFTYGNNLALNRRMDSDGRLAAMQVADTALLLDLNYGYDAFNNISSISDDRPGKSQNFSYDPLHRLQQAIGYYGNYRYGYDATGNRSSRDIITRSGTSINELYAVDPDSNRLNYVERMTNGTLASRTMLYDEAGNISLQSGYDGRTSSMNYNVQNRLQETVIAR